MLPRIQTSCPLAPFRVQTKKVEARFHNAAAKILAARQLMRPNTAAALDENAKLIGLKK